MHLDNMKEIRGFYASIIVLFLMSYFIGETESVSMGPGWNFYSGAGQRNEIDTCWSSGGGNSNNDRNLRDSSINGDDLDFKNPTFKVIINASTTANPAMCGNAMIAPSWDGSLRAFHRLTGKILWDLDIGMSFYGATVKGTKISRTTPTLWATYHLVIGVGHPADLLVINMFNGELFYKITLDKHPHSVITGSGTVNDRNIFVPISSTEEIDNVDNATYECCTFIGSVVSVDLIIGEVSWKTMMINKHANASANHSENFSGVNIWGSTPSINADLNLVYFATGNYHTTPSNYSLCMDAKTFETTDVDCDFLENYDNHPNSVLALNMFTGEVVWKFDAREHVAWKLACDSSNGRGVGNNCPDSTIMSNNYDFGMNPALSTMCTGFDDSNVSDCLSVLYVAQKSGILYCINSQNGELIWANQTAPGGHVGGIQWGLAVDDRNVYFSIYNDEHLPWMLSNGTVIHGGGWAAHDKITGHVVWSTANPSFFDPTGPPNFQHSNGRSTYSFGAGAPLSVNDLILVTSADTVYLPNLGAGIPISTSGGWFYALNKTNGFIVDSFQSNVGTISSFSGNQCSVCAGNGYKNSPFGMANGTAIFCWTVSR